MDNIENINNSKSTDNTENMDNRGNMNNRESMDNRGSVAGSFVKNLLIDIVIAVLLAAAVLYFVRPTIVKQSSMENTFMENDYLIMYERAYKNKTPERGDIVIFRSSLINEETGDSKLLIKRVIGLPGDEISINNDMLYIIGEYYEEDYLKDGYTPAHEVPLDGETFTVPEDQYYVMGDNRVVSVDSRYSEIGCITVDQIKGKVILRLFPLNQIQKF